MPPDETHRIALALEALKGSVDSGIAAVRGDINLLAHRTQDNRDDIDELDGRVKGLEDRRFPLPVISGLMSVAAVVISVVVMASGKG